MSKKNGKKKGMFGNFPQRCYVMKAAKELDIKGTFTYIDLLQASKVYSPELKKNTLYSIGAVLVKEGLIIKSTIRDPKTGLANTYLVTELGKKTSWKDTPTGHGIYDKPDKKKKKVKLVKDGKEVKVKKKPKLVKRLTRIKPAPKKEPAINEKLLRTQFVEDVLLYIEELKKERNDYRALYNDINEKFNEEVKVRKQIVKEKDKTIAELEKAVEILKSKMRDSTGKTVLLKDVAKFKSEKGVAL